MRVPSEQRQAFLSWIDDNGPLRRDHGIFAEVVLERSPRQNPAKTLQPQENGSDPDELVVITVWPDHDTFDAWINTPDRERLTASPTHEAVEFRPITRYDLVGGYLTDALTSGGRP